MADNLPVNNDDSTLVGTIATDEIASVHYPRSKVGFGVDGAYVDVSASDPLPVTLSGVATAANQTTGNTSLATIAGAVSGTEMQVDVLTMPTVTVQATNLDIRDLSSASDSVAVTDGSGSLTVDAPVGNPVFVRLSDGSSAIATLPVSVASIPSHDVTNAGTFAVQVSSALPAGTNAIGKLSANSGVDIGDVDVTSVPTDPFGANSDAASATGSISAKLRFIASTGIPITGTVTVGSHAVTNAGTFVVQIDGAALAALQLIDDPVLTDDAAFTPATSKVMMSGFEADETSTDSVDEGDAGAARMTLDRKQIVAPQPHTQGGLSIFRSLDIDETEEDVKTSPGQVYGWYIFNASTSVRYVKFYNATAANVTVGSTTPALTIPVPAASSGGVGMVFSVPGTHGIAFDTAISVAATTALADNDSGAPSANDVVIDVLYK